jgi:hypothetical protein
MINNNSLVYYKGSIKVDEAEQLGAFLLKQGYFNDTDDRTVQILKQNKTFIVRFILDEKQVAEDKENILFSFQIWKQWLQENVFHNQETKVVLVNDRLEKIADITSLEEDENKAFVEMNDTVLFQERDTPVVKGDKNLFKD